MDHILYGSCDQFSGLSASVGKVAWCPSLERASSMLATQFLLFSGTPLGTYLFDIRINMNNVQKQPYLRYI